VNDRDIPKAGDFESIVTEAVEELANSLRQEIDKMILDEQLQKTLDIDIEAVEAKVKKLLEE
jgi:hypothetical protein